jgi:hypothetical protein
VIILLWFQSYNMPMDAIMNGCHDENKSGWKFCNVGVGVVEQ